MKRGNLFTHLTLTDLVVEKLLLRVSPARLILINRDQSFEIKTAFLFFIHLNRIDPSKSDRVRDEVIDEPIVRDRYKETRDHEADQARLESDREIVEPTAVLPRFHSPFNRP